MIIKGRNFRLSGSVVSPPPPTPPSPSGNIVIQVTFASAPLGATSAYPNLKYEKHSMVNFEWDDSFRGSLIVRDMFANKFFTDGAGNNKKYTFGVAVNGRNQYDNREIGLNADLGITYAEGLSIVNAGGDIQNHGLYHEPTGNYNNGSDSVKNLVELDALYFAKTGYKMSALVVPTNYTGYMTAAAAAGYATGSSTGTFDGFTRHPLYTVVGSMNDIPAGSDYIALGRGFTDTWDTQFNEYKGYIDQLLQGVSPTVNKFFRVGSHNLTAQIAFTNLIDYLEVYANDKIWVTTMREFAEYRKAKALTVKTESLVGNVLTITLNQDAFPAQMRWRDLSLKVTSNTNITNVVVTGADSSSFNATAKLINIFKQDLVFSSVPPVVTTPPDSTIPVNTADFTWLTLDGRNAMQLNNFEHSSEYLFDGLNVLTTTPNWGQILPTNQVVYEFKGNATINKIRLWDGQGSHVTNPIIIEGMTANFVKTTLITFTADGLNVNTEFSFPNNPVFKYLIISHPTGQIALGEIGVFGVESGRNVVPYVKRKVYLNDQLGTNAFEWEFVDPNAPHVIEPVRAEVIKSFSGIRHYLDWHTIEPVEGQFTFNPSHRGGWNLDAIYSWMKLNGIMCVPCLKESPQWMYEMYTDGSQTSKLNTPIKPNRDRSVPANYDDFAEAVFQLSARMGYTVVPLSQVKIFTGLRWAGDTANEKKTGLGLIKYIEIENERDKWWAGRNGYQTAYEYAAMLSACYDGHMGTMGVGYGAKTADPNIKVVMCGTANPRPDYMKGIIDWCKQYRGYLPDGTVNLCFDIANVHDYSNDSGSSQGGTPTRGAAPEKSQAGKNAEDWIWNIEQFVGKDVEFWNTEMGFDVNQGSILKAIAIGARSVVQTQSDWLVRTCLLHASKGVNRTLAYMLNDVNIASTERFSSCGMAGRPVQTAYNNLKIQTAGYYFLEKVSQDPSVHIYKNDAGLHLYICWIPDEIGRTAQYTLTKKNGTQVVLQLTETPQVITD